MKQRSQPLRIHIVLFLLLLSIPNITFIHGLQRIAVFGGSGFIGSRICQILASQTFEKCDVISISKSGSPPSWAIHQEWTDRVEWISADLTPNNTNNDKLSKTLMNIDGAISCIGNMNPNPEFTSFWGLAFDDERLRVSNGVINEHVCKLAKHAGAKRFGFVSVSYESAKALEGPLSGYLAGKRLAEHAIYTVFNDHNDTSFVVGPSLVYGGKRFPKLGNMYAGFVKSGPVRAYLNTNQFLRNLSSAPITDWLEAMLSSPPVEVNKVAMVMAGGVLGLINEEEVPERRQGFYGLDGKDVMMDPLVFVDGTDEIERVASLVEDKLLLPPLMMMKMSAVPSSALEEEPFEGALVGKKPYLFPIPVAAFFMLAFAAIATNQFAPGGSMNLANDFNAIHS